MEALEEHIFEEDFVSEIQDPFYESTDQYVSGKFLRYVTGFVFLMYGITGFVLQISEGYYVFKVAILASCSLLLLSPPSYPFLVGLLIPVYYYLKTSQFALVEYTYVAHFAPTMIILMVVCNFVWKQFGDYKRNPYQRFGLASFCLLGIIGFGIIGGLAVINPYLYFNRMVYLVAFAGAFYLGRSCVNVQQSLKLLLGGLALGVFAFELPYSVGYLLRQGVGTIGSLASLRSEIGAGTGVGTESGTLLVIFALAFSLSGSGVSIKMRRYALWMVAIPAAVVILIFLSRGAVLLLVGTVFLNLILSGRRRTAMVGAVVFSFLGVIAFIRFPEIFLSFAERMADIADVAQGRYYIRMEGIRIGMAHLFHGIGAGQYSVHSQVTSAHNEEITMFAEHGAIALILYVLFWFYIVYMALKLRISKVSLDRSMAGVFLVLLGVHFLYIQIQPMYFNRGGLLFTFLVGMLVTLYNRSQDNLEIDEINEPVA